ncbi:MAG: hypothetical protein R3C17_17210 [Planctomycetaceae bacterium]
MPADTIIDLDGSKLPLAWRPRTTSGLATGAFAPSGSGNLQYSQYMDVVFSPRGNVIGTASTAGVIHFYVCDNLDSRVLKEEFVQRLTLIVNPGPPDIDETIVPAGYPATMRFSENGQELDMAQS